MEPTFPKNSSLLPKLPAIFKGDTREYIILQTATLVFFLAFAIIDIYFSVQNTLLLEAVIVPFIFLLQAIEGLASINTQHRYFNPKNIFIINTTALFFISFVSGYSSGSFFYYFPALMSYFGATLHWNNSKRFRQFFIITLFFMVALMVNYIFFPPRDTRPFINEMIAYRFLVAVILSVVMIKKLFATQTNIQNKDGRREYHEALFQSYLDAYIIFNQETREVIDYNKRMLSLFELPPDSDLKNLYITQVMMRYLAEDSVNKELMLDNIPDNWHGEAGFITHNKKPFYSYVKSVVYFRDESKYQILSIRDITNMKDTEKELIVYKESVEKAGRAKARFLSSMSHELRTPLNGIIGTSNLIKSEATLPANIQKHIDVLLYSSDHMLGIINDILDFSKIDAGKLELKKQSFNLNDCIHNIAGTFETQFTNKNIQLIIEQSPQLEKVNIISDEVKLSQVIANLLSNALKFTLEGSVTLDVKVVNTTPEKVTIHFEVKDTGIGIPKEKQLEIFQGFAQVHADELSRRFGGTGLGLTISEKLVNIFGGKLEVESELEKGSRFYFTISFEPAILSETLINNSTIAENDTDIRGIKILIVEDNEINAIILKSFLKKWEIQVKEAGNGVHAIELLKFHRFDLVLLDLEMPEMDGYTAIKIIRQTDQTTPVLAFTASLLENMDQLLAEAGFNGYVLKPYRPEDLKVKIEKFAPHRKINYV